MPCVRTAEGLWPRSGRVRVAVWGHDGLGCRGAEEPVRRQKPRFGRSLGCERRVELDRRRSPMLLAAPRSAVLPVVCHSQAFEKGEAPRGGRGDSGGARPSLLPESRPESDRAAVMSSTEGRSDRAEGRSDRAEGRTGPRVGPGRGSRYSKRAYLITDFIRPAGPEIRGLAGLYLRPAGLTSSIPNQ